MAAFRLAARTLAGQNDSANRLGRADSVVIDNSYDQLHLLHLFEGHLKRKRLVEMRIQGALLNGGFLFLYALSCLREQTDDDDDDDVLISRRLEQLGRQVGKLEGATGNNNLPLLIKASFT